MDLEPPIPHLSFAVHDLDAARRFNVYLLGGELGRRREAWIDVWLGGQQLTFQLPPEELPKRQGKWHFGATLWIDAWESEVRRLRDLELRSRPARR